MPNLPATAIYAASPGRPFAEDADKRVHAGSAPPSMAPHASAKGRPGDAAKTNKFNRLKTPRIRRVMPPLRGGMQGMDAEAEPTGMCLLASPAKRGHDSAMRANKQAGTGRES